MSLPKCCKCPSNGVHRVYSLWESPITGRRVVVAEVAACAYHVLAVAREVKNGAGASDVRVFISPTEKALRQRGRVGEPC